MVLQLRTWIPPIRSLLAEDRYFRWQAYTKAEYLVHKRCFKISTNTYNDNISIDQKVPWRKTTNISKVFFTSIVCSRTLWSKSITSLVDDIPWQAWGKMKFLFKNIFDTSYNSWSREQIGKEVRGVHTTLFTNISNAKIQNLSFYLKLLATLLANVKIS